MIPRKSYTVKYKLQVLALVDNYSLSFISLKLRIPKSNICKWRQQRDKLLLCCNQNSRKIGSGKRVDYPKEETELFEWVMDQRQKLVPITLQDVRNETKD